MTIINATKKTIVATEVKIANTFITRLIGLLNRKSISPEEALIIYGCRSIHMFFMKFSIDVIFMNKENRIVGLVENIKPFRVSPTFLKSYYAIELAVGTIEKTRSQQGDQLIVN